MNKIIKFLFILLFLLAAGPSRAYVSLGGPTGWVNDFAQVLTSEQKQTLEQKLKKFNADTSNEISVVFIKNLAGDTIENFASELFKDWGIGQKDKDNGILVLIAMGDRAMRIEVGYGLEGALTDAQASWLISDVLKPAFQQNEYYSGVDQAVDKIIAATQGEYLPETSNSPSLQFSLDWIWFIFFVFIWLGAIMSRSKSWWLGGVFGAIIALVITFLKDFLYFGLVSFIVLIPLGLLFDFLVSRKYQQAKAQGKHVPWWIGGGRGGGFGGGGFGGFGGFGGGHSGGGGASGRW